MGTFVAGCVAVGSALLWYLAFLAQNQLRLRWQLESLRKDVDGRGEDRVPDRRQAA
ncbi:MAG: hypothetical protein HYS13_06335 [Planctomycetia bacterium]|nr:hypothetical protein [Planctomycetia bacterium]